MTSDADKPSGTTAGSDSAPEICTKIRQGDTGVTYPRYLTGQGSCPPEDCGSIPGFYETLDILADPAHPEYDDLPEEFDGWDPDTIDENRIAVSLARIAGQLQAPVCKRRRPPG